MSDNLNQINKSPGSYTLPKKNKSSIPIKTKQPKENIKTIIRDNPKFPDERYIKNQSDEDYLENHSYYSETNSYQYPLDFTKSRRNNNLTSVDMNLEEIFEFEKQQKRINTEKVVTSWTDKREELVDIWIKELEFYQVISYFYLF